MRQHWPNPVKSSFFDDNRQNLWHDYCRQAIPMPFYGIRIANAKHMPRHQGMNTITTYTVDVKVSPAGLLYMHSRCECACLPFPVGYSACNCNPTGRRPRKWEFLRISYIPSSAGTFFLKRFCQKKIKLKNTSFSC